MNSALERIIQCFRCSDWLAWLARSNGRIVTNPDQFGEVWRELPDVPPQPLPKAAERPPSLDEHRRRLTVIEGPGGADCLVS
jgi:hypothetical protein